jgi:hypothetical protein
MVRSDIDGLSSQGAVPNTCEILTDFEFGSADIASYPGAVACLIALLVASMAPRDFDFESVGIVGIPGLIAFELAYGDGAGAG